MNNTDQKYIEKILNGDTETFGLLVNTYSSQTFRLIFRIVHNPEDAEELTQDCFLKAYQTLHTFKGECLFSTWLYRIAYNTAISATRKKKQEFLYVDEQAINRIPEQDVDALFEHEINENQLKALNEALQCLLPDERGMLQLFYNEQKTINDIAIVTGLSVPNVKVKLHRTRKKLYVLLNHKR